MYLAIDIVLVAVMAATLFKAAKRGFIGSLFSLVTVAVSIIAAMMFYKELSVYINDAHIYKPVEEYVLSLIADTVAENGGTFDFSALPEGIFTAADAIGVDINEMLVDFSGEAETFAVSLAVKIAATVSNILAFVIIFLAAFIVLKLVSLLLDIVAKLPVLHGLNKTLGILFGAVEAFVLGMIIASVAVSLCGVYGAINNDAAFLEVAEKTVVAKFLLSICPW